MPTEEQTRSVHPEEQGRARWAAWDSDEVPPISGTLAIIGFVLLGLEAIFGMWLRFSTTSLLWLDEALTVNIARLPLKDLHQALRRDGAPPLYYVLLHFWMGLVGQSDGAVRSLSGIFSVLTVVVVFFLIRRIWSLEVALIASAILLAMPFATYYATEVRMYSLVMLLVSLGGLCLARLFERPTVGRALLLALCVVALEYTHYWWTFLIASLGIWLIVTLLVSRDAQTRRASVYSIGALVLAGIAFVPWLPTFLFQSAHTGTPWANAPGVQTALTGVLHFYDNQALQAPVVGPAQAVVELMTVALVVLGIFGLAKGGPLLELDARGRVRGRFLGWIIFVTLTFGIVGAYLSKSTFVPRYASVIFIPLVILLAVGTRSIELPWLRLSLVGILVVALLVGANADRTTQRSQAGQVAQVLTTQAAPGDLVVFCPDQLGPSVMRELPNTPVRAVGYPRFDDPHFINWVDYTDAIKATSPHRFANRVAEAVGNHHVWLVWSTGYGPFKNACPNLAGTLLTLPGWGAHQWVNARPAHYFQSMNLTQFTPAGFEENRASTP